MAFRTILLASITVGFLAGCQPDTASTPETGARPNILLIMADDLGVNDLGIQHAGKPVTPTLDQLGDTGLRFQRHYADTSCAPSRVALLTGQHPAQHGFNPINIGISPEVETLPELLRAQGYGTHHIGKWHVGSRHPLAWPLQQGFDTFFGFLDQFQLSIPDHLYTAGTRRPRYHNPWLQEGNALPHVREGHLTDLLGQAARERIQQVAESQEPWFINLWFLAPHTPLEPSEKYALQFPDTDEGRYLALIAHMDDQIREVIETLKKTGQYDNTLIVFLSDNGGTNNTRDSNQPHQGYKASASEGGMRVPLILHWPSHIPAGQQRNDITTQADLFTTLLSATNIPVPADRTGLDLLTTPQTPNRVLFWESDNWHGLSQSILSANGYWRLDDGVLKLLDTRNIPSNRDIDAVMHSYREWRQETLEFPIEYIATSPQGHAQLTGNSFLRAPGYQGFTLKLAFKTSNQTNNQANTLLYQSPWWHIWLDETGHLNVQLPDIRLKTEIPVSADKCHELIVSSLYIRQLTSFDSEVALATVFIDNRPVAQKTVNPASLPENGWIEPTWIGSMNDKKNPFPGWISRPILRREYMGADTTTPPEKHISQLPPLCTEQ